MIFRRFAAFACWMACAALAPHHSRTPRVERVSIRGFAFVPAELDVAVGDTVVWTNADQFVHTTAADSAAWSSPEMRPSERFVWIARRPGRLPYHCAAHPTMRGSILVRP
ncbi:MAG TPA: hypothetical protein VKH19_16420 [Gemmatimonadaceae bacterium]|nr:hypothetical protein [Gemmatimonadaceae bacterium]